MSLRPSGRGLLRVGRVAASLGIAVSGLVAVSSAAGLGATGAFAGTGAQLVDPNTQLPLTGTEPSTQNFEVLLPSGAACSSASSTSAIRVGSFMVDTTAFSNPANYTYNSAGTVQDLALYDPVGNVYAAENTEIPNAQGQGPINQPGAFSWFLYTSNNAFDKTGTFATDNPNTGTVNPGYLYPGTFNIGIACYNSSTGATDGSNYWSIEIQVKASASDPNGFTYNVAPTTTATTTVLTSAKNPSVTGQKVTLTAKVAPTPDGGTVTFSLGGTPVTACTAKPVTAGKATCIISPSAAGSFSYTATYSGDANFGGSSSSALIQKVNAATTTTKLTSSANPSAVKQKVTYTAVVTPVAPGAGKPTGTVAFKDGSTVITGCSAKTVSAGKATCPITYTATGSHSITAVYSGSSSYVTSTSSVLTQVVN